ncbi:MAG: ATP-binding protein [Desulfotomaculum sp.]|nr:ATP-binding protein [Desulfotomaculum sp.]
MRIGICGAPGTGKTTLSKIVAEELKLPHIEEQARVAARQLGITRPSRDIKNNPQLGLAYELLCLVMQLESEDKYKRSFVSDRTVIDIAVYWRKWYSINSPSSLNRSIFELCRRRSKLYNLVVYIPPEIPLEDDRFRSTDPDYQSEMDVLTKKC